jgi:hypothetical protein
VLITGDLLIETSTREEGTVLCASAAKLHPPAATSKRGRLRGVKLMGRLASITELSDAETINL